MFSSLLRNHLRPITWYPHLIWSSSWIQRVSLTMLLLSLKSFDFTRFSLWASLSRRKLGVNKNKVWVFESIILKWKSFSPHKKIYVMPLLLQHLTLEVYCKLYYVSLHYKNRDRDDDIFCEWYIKVNLALNVGLVKTRGDERNLFKSVKFCSH